MEVKEYRLAQNCVDIFDLKDKMQKLKKNYVSLHFLIQLTVKNCQGNFAPHSETFLKRKTPNFIRERLFANKIGIVKLGRLNFKICFHFLLKKCHFCVFFTNFACF
jgi:hypothetical protein